MAQAATQPEVKDIQAPEYTEIEKNFRSTIIAAMEESRRQREQPHPEFDEQTYSQHWESNAKANNSYIAPKINEQDVRITTGTTREKSGTILNAALNYNYEANITAYDKNDMEVERLGTYMGDCVNKSRKLEKPRYDVKKVVIYHEFFTQGTIVCEDTNVEYSIPQKDVGKFTGFEDFDFENENMWKERMDKVYKYCDTNLICGLNVFFGNIREFYLELQPFMVIRRLIPRSVAKSLYGKWKRWENVPELTTQTQEDAVSFNNWSLQGVPKGMVEEIKYYNKWDNNYMVMLNGVMMFPVKMHKNRFSTFPLSALTGVCEYPLVKADCEPISRFFAYSKSFPAKMKVDQQVYDEMLKAIILKTRKSYNPPMANNTGKTLSKKIFYPATIHNGINPDKLQEIGNNTGVTASEFQAVQFIKGIIDEKSVSGIMQGQSQPGRQTAREVIELKQQSMLKMGLAIIGIINLEQGLCHLRLRNILKYWTQPLDTKTVEMRDGVKKKVSEYRKIMNDVPLASGVQGKRQIEFTGEAFPTPQQIGAEEKLLTQITGKPVEKIYINAEELAAVDYYWDVEVVPTEKQTSSLKIALFDEFVASITKNYVPFGKVPSWDYLAERATILRGEDPSKIWPKQQQPMLPPGQPGQMGQPPNPLQAAQSPMQSKPDQVGLSSMLRMGG